MQEDLAQKPRLSHYRLFFWALSYLRPREQKMMKTFTVSIICIILTSASTLLIPVMMKLAVDTLKTSGNIEYLTLFVILVGYGLMWTSSQVFLQLREILAFPIFERAVTLLSIDIVAHLSKLSLRYHLDRKTGALTNAVERAQHSLPKVIWGVIYHCVPASVEIAIAAAILFYLYSYVYALILMSTFAIFLLFLMWGSSWAVKARRESAHHEAEANARVVDGLLNVKTVRFFGNQAFEAQAIKRKLFDRERYVVRFLRRMEGVLAIKALILGIGLTIVIIVAGMGVQKGVHTIGDFVLLMGYSMQLMIPLVFFGKIIKDMREGLASMENIYELLHEKIEVSDIEGAKELKVNQGQVIFENISFGYDPRRPILKEGSRLA